MTQLVKTSAETRAQSKESEMITVKEKLIALADTEAERELIAMWMDEDREKFCARQRAWEKVNARVVRGELRLRW